MGCRVGGVKLWILLAVCAGTSATAQAACTGPQQLLSKLQAHPTTANAIELGNWYAGHKQFACAAHTFESALKGDPSSAQLHYLEALALVGTNNPAGAVQEVEQAIKLQPDAIKPHLLLASLDDQAGRAKEADSEWRKALAIDPGSEIALEGLSGSMLARKDYVGVVGLLQRAPRTEVLAFHLAEAMEELNYLDGALDVLLEATKLKPDSLMLANAESVVLVKKKSYQEAVKLWSYTVQHHPGNRLAELQFLRILVLTMHNDQALPLARKMLAQTPHDPEVLYLNGVLDEVTGDNVTAKGRLEEAVSKVPDFYYSHYYLGLVLVRLHEWQEARDNLEKSIALGFSDPKVHYELSLAMRGLGDNEGAAKEVKIYQEMRNAEETQLEATNHAAKADLEMDQGKTQDAINDYKQAIEEAPKDSDIRYKLSVALHKSGDWEGERAQLEQVVQQDPRNAQAQKELGFLLTRSGDLPGAVDHFRLAVEAAPGWMDAWVNLAGCLAEAGRYADAREAVTMALRLDPANPRALKLRDQLASDPSATQ